MFESWFSFLSPKQFADFKKFLLDNNIIATTAGVLIAYSAWDFIQSFVGDLALPGIYFLFIAPFFSNDFVSSVFEPVNRLNLPKFITRSSSFIIVIIFTFLVIQYIIKNWLADPASNATTVVLPKEVNENIVGNNVAVTIQNSPDALRNFVPPESSSSEQLHRSRLSPPTGAMTNLTELLWDAVPDSRLESNNIKYSNFSP